MGSTRSLHEAVLLGLAISLPAAAQEFQIFLPDRPPCFAAGAAAYRGSATARTPDYRVKIDNRAVHPGLRMQLVDDPAAADFVLADDIGAVANDACRAAMPPKTIRIDDAAAHPRKLAHAEVVRRAVKAASTVLARRRCDTMPA